MSTSPDRLTALEMRTTEQDRTVEELSAQIAEQWTVIERLRKQVEALTERFLEFEHHNASEVPVAKPPHW